MHSRSWVLCLTLVTACGGGASSTHTATPAGTYEIRLTRHASVGVSWGEATHFAEIQQTVVHDAAGTVVADTTSATTIVLSGEYTVLTVGPDGDPMRLRLVVQSFTVDSGEGPATPTMPSALVIDRGPDGGITGENGEALDPALVTVLRSVVPDHAPPVDDDLVFGTRDPQAVGASWPIDSAGAARGLAALQLSVDPSNVTGNTTLVAAGNEDGHDILELRSVIAAHHVGMPGLPAGSVEQRADLLAGIDMILPTDTSLPPLREMERSAVDVQVVVPSPSGPQTVDVSVRQEATHMRTLR